MTNCGERVNSYFLFFRWPFVTLKRVHSFVTKKSVKQVNKNQFQFGVEYTMKIACGKCILVKLNNSKIFLFVFIWWSAKEQQKF